MARAVLRKSRVETMRNSCGSRRCSMSITALRAASNVTVRKCWAWPRTRTIMSRVSRDERQVSRRECQGRQAQRCDYLTEEGLSLSDDLDLHLPDLVLD